MIYNGYYFILKRDCCPYLLSVFFSVEFELYHIILGNCDCYIRNDDGLSYNLNLLLCTVIMTKIILMRIPVNLKKMFKQ